MGGEEAPVAGRGELDLLRDGRVVLGLGDELGLEHLGEHDVAHDDGLGGRRNDVAGLATGLLGNGLSGRVQPGRGSDEAGQHGGLADGELILLRVGGQVLSEVGVRRRPDAVGVVAVVDLVQVHLDDPLLPLLPG